MDPKLAEAIGLLRHSIISPVLMDRASAQMAYFRQMSERDFDVPGKGPRRFSATAMKGWLYRYRKYGFPGITPKTRSDAGGFRKLSQEARSQIKKLRLENLDQSAVKFYDACIKASVLGDPPVGLETLRRYLKSENLYRGRSVTPRKRFEMGRFGELWTCDFMHGPEVFLEAGGKRRHRAILLAIIDDHSRMIVGWRWGLHENTKLIEAVFKDAILGYGLPDRFYCDNGAAFSSQYLARVCAHLNVGLVHSKPYDSPSRGKIERFFRTVRESFLSETALKLDAWDLEKLSQEFSRWLREGYHHAAHRGIGDLRPIDRYQISIREAPRKRVAEEDLDEFFLVTVERVVNKDCTFSLNSVYYEVPAQFIGRKVEIKFSQENPSEVYLYDERGLRVCKCLPVDSVLNGKSFYQPQSRISEVALHSVAQAGGRSS